MSMYLGGVAAFYIRLSNRNIRRIEHQMRRRLQRAKDRAEQERTEVLRRAYRGQEVQVEAAASNIVGKDGRALRVVNTHWPGRCEMRIIVASWESLHRTLDSDPCFRSCKCHGLIPKCRLFGPIGLEVMPCVPAL